MISETDRVDAIVGVGEKLRGEYGAIGIHSVGELLNFLPSGYIDRGTVQPIESLSVGDRALIRAEATNSGRTFYRGRLSITTVDFDCDGNHVQAVFYNQPYRKNQISVGSLYLLYGTVSMRSGAVVLSGALCEAAERPQSLHEGLCAVYPRTGSLSPKVISKHIRYALDNCEPEEYLPFWLLSEQELPSRAEMLQYLHFPQSEAELASAQSRARFEEFLRFCLGVLSRQSTLSRERAERLGASPDEFLAALPFELTAAQKRVLDEILADMKSGTAMNRLLCGDVGSGKTAVAAAAAAVCAASGAQAAICAPTEILARQHYDKYSVIFAQLGVSCALLYSSLTKKARESELKKIKSGQAKVIFGTHALFSADVEYEKLKFAAIDEQQRYGVGQRAALAHKGSGVHVLVMTATPIPRTLALSLSRELDLSELSEAPKGRLPILTYTANAKMEQRLYAFVKAHLQAGERAYIVCPAIDDEEMENVLAVYEQASRILSGFSVSCITGAMKENEKNRAMRAFADGTVQVLIATSVIEVGIDVPEASIMWVKGSERFGLSQLHQLRGRVGRGSVQSYCILQTASSSASVKARLGVLKNNSSGFDIAKADLYARGCGELLGTRQSGSGGVISLAAENEELFSAAERAAVRLHSSSAARDRLCVQKLTQENDRAFSGIVLN